MGEKAAFPCPNGPVGVDAQRLCMVSGAWSLSIEDQRCSGGSATEQLLADISSSVITASTSEELSGQLASLSTESPLSLQEVETVTSLAVELVKVGATDVLVSIVMHVYNIIILMLFCSSVSIARILSLYITESWGDIDSLQTFYPTDYTPIIIISRDIIFVASLSCTISIHKHMVCTFKHHSLVTCLLEAMNLVEQQSGRLRIHSSVLVNSFHEKCYI